jgi:Tfp pilus assembly protein PilF
MKVLATVAVALVVWISAPSQQAHAQLRLALLIGNATYNAKVGGALKNPHNDVATVGRALEAVGFRTTIVRDATRRDVLSEVRAFAERLAQGDSDTIGFFYYSGHGISRPEDRANYLIPVDLRDTDSSDFWFDAVKLDDILAELARVAPSAAHFVVFDACRNELKLPSKSVGKLGFAPVMERAGMYIAFATSPGAVASDQGATSGPYAGALAAELTRSGQDHLQLFQNVKEGVYSSTGNRQLPWASDGMVKRMYLSGLPAPDRPGFAAPAPAPQPPAPPPTPQTSEATREWARVDKANSAELQTFLRRHGASPEADYARARLEELKEKLVVTPSGEQRPTESQGPCSSKPNEANLDAFIKGCNELIARNPRHETAYFSRGRAYLSMAQYDAALQDFNRAIEISPRLAEAYSGRGAVYVHKKQYDRAIREFSQSIAIKPTPAAYNNMGLSYMRQGQSERALPLFNKAIEIDPHYARAYANRGDIYLQQGNRNRAMAEYRQALSLDPTYERVRRALEGFGVKR